MVRHGRRCSECNASSRSRPRRGPRSASSAWGAAGPNTAVQPLEPLAPGRLRRRSQPAGDAYRFPPRAYRLTAQCRRARRRVAAARRPAREPVRKSAACSRIAVKIELWGSVPMSIGSPEKRARGVHHEMRSYPLAASLSVHPSNCHLDELVAGQVSELTSFLAELRRNLFETPRYLAPW